MKTLTIRQASGAIGRAPATIRRYIKSGRLPAEKQQGKFGEEYKISSEDLQSFGVAVRESLPAVREPQALATPVRSLLDEINQKCVPRDLYNELVMKHERLLVQHGMIRAGGQKLLEYRADAEVKESLLAEREKEIREMREQSEREIDFLQTHLSQAEVEIEDRNIELTLLREKVRRLEMNAASGETIRSFDEEVRSAREKEGQTRGVPTDEEQKRNAQKIGLLQNWLKACETERERGDS